MSTILVGFGKCEPWRRAQRDRHIAKMTAILALINERYAANGERLDKRQKRGLRRRVARLDPACVEWVRP